MHKVVVVPLAEGFEELEAVTIIDVLRRAGVRVVVCGLEDTGLVASQGGVYIRPDSTLELLDANNIDGIVLPGGWGGTQRLAKSESLLRALKMLHASNKLIGAICAAPYALSQAGILEGKKFTCYPGVESKINDGNYTNIDAVVRDGNLITSKGPATALEFALALVENLYDNTQSAEIAKALLFQ